MKSIIAVMTGLLPALVLVGCEVSGIRTGSECAVPQRVASYRSFAWVGAPANQRQATFITAASLEQLEAAIVDAMQLAGLRLDTTSAADLLVTYRVSTQEYVDPRLPPAESAAGWGHYDELPSTSTYAGDALAQGDPVDAESGEQSAPRTYSEARLAIEMIERSTGVIVWRGWAEKEITLDDRADPTALARGAAQAVLEGFPRPECD